MNLLAADIVTIYEYIEADKRFLTPPDIAGRLKDKGAMFGKVYKGDLPELLVKSGGSSYQGPNFEDIGLGTRRKERNKSENDAFIERERIKSSAGILLRVGKETVGVLFINYRRTHTFSNEEKTIIDILAASAAIAIKNRRLLETFDAADRDIISTLDLGELLNLIVPQCVHITGADFGEIRLLDPIDQQLVSQAKHLPASVSYELQKRIPLGEGITGWVAKHGLPELIVDVEDDPRYIGSVPDVKSELCVPLLDKDRCVLGVLNMESYRPAAFSRRDQRILEALANQAVIAIQNAENQKQRVAAEAMATLGDVAGQLVHRMGNDIGAIKVFAEDIQEEGDALSKKRACEILPLAERILEEARQLNSWILEKPKLLIDIHEIIGKAIEQVRIPEDIKITVELPNDSLLVFSGKAQLIGVFVNLLQNAADAMPNGGTLSIGGEIIEGDRQRWVGVWVKDTGTGIAEEDYEKVFRRDYSTKKDTKKGLGFGLWWARTYVERLGGRLSVESKLGQWTQFTVTLMEKE